MAVCIHVLDIHVTEIQNNSEQSEVPTLVLFALTRFPKFLKYRFCQLLIRLLTCCQVYKAMHNASSRLSICTPFEK